MPKLPAFLTREAARFTSYPAAAPYSIDRHPHGQLGGKRPRLGKLSHRSLPELMETTLVQSLSGDSYTQAGVNIQCQTTHSKAVHST